MFAEAATASAGGSGADDGASSVVNQAPELVPVWFRDAEQLADHGERQREGEALDQVDDGVAARLEVVKQPAGDRLDTWPKGRDPRPAEAAEASRRSRVWSGGSTLSMCRARAGPGRPSATTAPSRASAACMSLDRPAWLSAALASSWPDDQPRAVPVGQRDLVHRAVRLDLREQRVRVVSVVVAPRVEGRVAHVDHPWISRKPEQSRSMVASRPSSILQIEVCVQAQRVPRRARSSR